MDLLPMQQCEWVVRPLIDAGLGVDRIQDLLYRLGFEAVVGEGRSTIARVWSLVDGEPAHVRAAWNQVIDRMLSLDRPQG